MIKRALILGVVALGLTAMTAVEADAYLVRRIAPVRRVAVRAVLPPYPVARRVAYGPVYRPVVRPAYYGGYGYGGYGYGGGYYGPGVSVNVGW